MINDVSIDAFSDELEKISGIIGDTGKAFRKFVSTGWNKPSGLYEQVRHAKGTPLQGKKMLDAAGKQVWAERPNATWMGTGKVSRFLPVGDKGILTGVTALQAKSALKPEDQQGMGRSRGERLSGLAGGTIGGLAGMGAMAHLPANPISWMGGAKAIPIKGLGITRSIIGALAGGIAGERLATTPFRAARKAEMPAAPVQEQQMMPNGGAV